MNFSFWMLIIVLAVAAFSIRVLGLFAGDTIRSSRFSWVLDDLPGLIVVALVASSLAGQSIGTWLAAAAALGVAYVTNHVIMTMCVGVAAYGVLVWIGL
ncbi:branched-chain amino acid transporter [Parasedimentitalea marina]|uniref:Branched-chain amino acid transporter n=1 Tax=Parasedimentitalea marina TaxID=2483033 RepID=A0A3T0N3W8_9RHOB|nr:AzlD domain-containing protein [Parasedimentitalea marina]AZV78684.1 branched-chain amino acid transporter [Parasedimentitalea marina]